MKGNKPTLDPLVALARSQIDHEVALARVSKMQDARARKLEAAARGEQLKAPPPCRIEREKRRLERAQAALAAAQAAADSATGRKANITDPDSRVMKTKDGWVQGYNAQAIVNQHQIVLACQVSQNTGDVELYQPMTSTLQRTLAAAGITTPVELMLADAGYCSEANLTNPGPDRLIATTKDHKQRRAARELGHTTGPPPPNATPRRDGTPAPHPPRHRRLQTTLGPDRTCLRRPQTQPRDPRLPPPRPEPEPVKSDETAW